MFLLCLSLFFIYLADFKSPSKRKKRKYSRRTKGSKVEKQNTLLDINKSTNTPKTEMSQQSILKDQSVSLLFEEESRAPLPEVEIMDQFVKALKSPKNFNWAW